MSELGERPKRKKLESGDVEYSPYSPPKRRLKGHHWVAIEHHVDKGYPFRWRLEKNEVEPPTMEELPPPGTERPVSPMYPTNKPPVENVPMGGVPRGDRD